MTKPNTSALAHAQVYADSCAAADPELRRFIINSFCAGFDKSAEQYKEAILLQNTLVEDKVAEISALKKKINYLKKKIKYGHVRKNSCDGDNEEK